MSTRRGNPFIMSNKLWTGEVTVKELRNGLFCVLWNIYDDYDLDPTLKEFITEKYKEKYCPTLLFDSFTQSEKMNYIMLRVELDKLLDIKNTLYKIFNDSN